VLSGLPFVALLNFRGDVNQSALLQAYGVLVTAALMLALVSLAVSALCKSSATALVVAYLLVLTICGAVLVPALIMLDVQQVPEVAKALHYAGRSRRWRRRCRSCGRRSTTSAARWGKTCRRGRSSSSSRRCSS
jgi:ABC-type transport system involved in multi-copper enzyme maturation permease subunit